MAEILNGRDELYMYNSTLQQERLLHFHGKAKLGVRLLVHWYAFLFFEDWRHDLWTKRFIRDQVRYTDDIQCAAARIVAAVRDRARSASNSHGHFDAFHVRRGEFQYKRTRVSAEEMHEICKDQLPDGTLVYMATDERNKDFFRDLANNYELVFLDDFSDLLSGVNSNKYGMIDQVDASRSRTFFGYWFSTYVHTSIATYLFYARLLF
jgi:GDP-fucose protein O-fucosyltransferase